MHSLSGIRAMNRKAVARYNRAEQPESETSRHCSYQGNPEDGIVLHSAKLRNTAFIIGKKAKLFLTEWFGTNSADRRDKIVESYFHTSPSAS
jgi:hypothetical protein